MASEDPKRKLLNEQFYKVLTKFNSTDFFRHVLQFFEGVTFHTLEKALEKYNYSKKMTDIGKLFVAYTKNYSYEELQTLYYDLLTLELVLYNKRKQWTAVLMRQGTNQPLDENCVDEIHREFRREGYTVRLNVRMEDDILWMVLVQIKRTKSNETKYLKPCYIACHTKRPYIFFSPKSINQDLLKILISGLGYNDYKICKLNGKNISSLIKMLKNQKEAPKHRAETSLVLKNTVADCVRLKGGLDFCQENIRSVHAQQILGDEKIELQKLTIRADTDWRGLRTLPEAEGSRVAMTLQIRSKDIGQTIDEMIKAGILNPPYPEWATQSSYCGKNVIDIA